MELLLLMMLIPLFFPALLLNKGDLKTLKVGTYEKKIIVQEVKKEEEDLELTEEELKDLESEEEQMGIKSILRTQLNEEAKTKDISIEDIIDI